VSAADLVTTDLLTQLVITTGVVSSAWLTNRVWKGKKDEKAAKAEAEKPPLVTALRFNDPTTPEGMLIQRLEADLTRTDRALEQAREQRAQDIAIIARLGAENLSLQQDVTERDRRILELEARLTAHGR
jgi:hypothetical protein